MLSRHDSVTGKHDMDEDDDVIFIKKRVKTSQASDPTSHSLGTTSLRLILEVIVNGVALTDLGESNKV